MKQLDITAILQSVVDLVASIVGQGTIDSVAAYLSELFAYIVNLFGGAVG